MDSGKQSIQFIGNVLVPTGVTLTIGNGAIVDLNGYYLEVNGTLIIQPGATINIGSIGDGIDVYGTMSAEGTSANPIQINGSVQGHIFFATYSAVWFYSTSTSWSQQTNSGSLIENTVFNHTGLEVQSGIRISDSTFLDGLTVESSSPTIVNNDITDLSVIQNPNIPSNSTAIQPEISNNTIAGGLYLEAGGGTVNDNTISGGNNNPNSGNSGALSLSDVYGDPVSTLVLRNLINNSPIGISCDIQSSYNNKAIIENNTVTNNTVGVQIEGTNVPSIINNNIYGNSYNAKLSGVSQQISLTNNWWGTTDQQAISQTIYDYKNDFTLGTVNFVPFLTAQNPEATPDPNAAISTPNTSPSATSTPSTTSNPTSVLSPSPSTTSSATSTATATPTPSASPSGSQSQPSTVFPFTDLIVPALVVVIIAVASGAFLLGKRTGKK